MGDMADDFSDGGRCAHEEDSEEELEETAIEPNIMASEPHIMRSDLLKQYDALIELTARMLWYEFPDDEFRHSEAVANWVHRIRQIANEIKGRCA